MTVCRFASGHRREGFPRSSFAPQTTWAGVRLTVVIKCNSLFQIGTRLTWPIGVINLGRERDERPLVFVVLRTRILRHLGLFAGDVNVGARRVIASTAGLHHSVRVMVIVGRNLLRVRLVDVYVRRQIRGEEDRLYREYTMTSSCEDI